MLKARLPAQKAGGWGLVFQFWYTRFEKQGRMTLIYQTGCGKRAVVLDKTPKKVDLLK